MLELKRVRAPVEEIALSTRLFFAHLVPHCGYPMN